VRRTPAHSGIPYDPPPGLVAKGFNHLPDFFAKCHVLFGTLATADCGILLHAIAPVLAHIEALVSEHEVPDVRSNEDTDNNITVIVHSQQHDEVSHCEL
jgi:hypothetical protein